MYSASRFSPYVTELRRDIIAAAPNDWHHADHVDALIQNVEMEARQRYARELLHLDDWQSAAAAETQMSPVALVNGVVLSLPLWALMIGAGWLVWGGA